MYMYGWVPESLLSCLQKKTWLFLIREMSLGLFFIVLSWTKNHSDQSTNLVVGQASWILWLKATKRIITLVYNFPQSVFTLWGQRIYQMEQLSICPPAYVKSCFKERRLLGFFSLRSLISQWIKRTIFFPKRKYNETEDEAENFFSILFSF